MDVIKLASTYFFGTEQFMSANSMIATVAFKRKIDAEKLSSSYRLLIMNHPLLQSKRVESSEKDMFEWGRFSPEELECLLLLEKMRLSRFFTEEEALAQYDPTNTRLPFRIFRLDEFRLIFAMNHALANGRSLVYWIKRWLEYYAGAAETEPKPLERAAESSGHRDRLLRIKKRMSAFLWMPVFVIGLLFKVMSKAEGRGKTVDLSHGRKPEPGGRHVKKAYCFSPEETGEILRQCKSKKMTLTEYICCRLTDGFLQHAPGKRRVLVSMPMDLQPLNNYSPETMCGNHVASLPMQFFRGGNLEKQVKSTFKWFKRGVPYALALSVASLTHSYRKYKKQCLELTLKPMPERYPLWDFSITLSNLGVIADPLMEEWMDSMYFSIKNQSLLLTMATFSGRLMAEVSVLENLYDPEEVFGLFDQILATENLLPAKRPELAAQEPAAISLSPS
ncbi:hypothetical protein [Paenibacillus macerans]|uniref:hypothetical protein n=1 Tax=Paenibacillus macerans TaxID=44252 RepID=UPI0020408A02|nr:hypothetical protein [Paenibacillus macerans]MCM3697947.1 hypothetical protein [Paenibacillus macerans]